MRRSKKLIEIWRDTNIHLRPGDKEPNNLAIILIQNVSFVCPVLLEHFILFSQYIKITYTFYFVNIKMKKNKIFLVFRDHIHEDGVLGDKGQDILAPIIHFWVECVSST